ncbi:MAG: hypothetical protein SPK50_03720 [Mobiluncus porci]|uniref:Uncharacterized protein n=1 Tax=Mobiluncus porci TaxID=2652278 RepID=A0A7K0K1D6_9ACTO|nr:MULTISPECIES: hypothetical protein [Mobiluncus]MCI6584338.1 hypothetical protein [Mobiluncus sp.]MDD7540663.1 hypothetical protein [Mobiluncus porci]MDY5748226.1 hypothetical protein [Mobiluncus porci]MST49293.1 hypothetical protein [Mobiluncus porci]
MRLMVGRVCIVQIDIIVNADLDIVDTYEKPALIDEWRKIPELWDKVRRDVDKHAPPTLTFLQVPPLFRDYSQSSTFSTRSGNLPRNRSFT